VQGVNIHVLWYYVDAEISIVAGQYNEKKYIPFCGAAAAQAVEQVINSSVFTVDQFKFRNVFEQDTESKMTSISSVAPCTSVYPPVLHVCEQHCPVRIKTCSTNAV